MKIFLICAVFISVLYDVNCTNNTEILNHMNKMKAVAMTMVKEKCYQNSSRSAENFKTLLDNATLCLMVTTQQSPVFVTPVNTFKHNIQNCFNEVMEELENCLPQEFKDLPQLDLDISFSLIDFAYENNEYLFSPQFSSYVQNCVKAVQADKTKDELLNCFDYNSNKFGLKATCDQLEKWEACLLAKIGKKCPKDERVEKVTKSFVEAIKEPCDEYVSSVTENSLDLLTLLAPYAPVNINPDLM